MPSVTQDREMPVPLQAIYSAITDFNAYPKFLPEVRSARCLPDGSDRIQRVEFEIEVVKSFVYTLEFEMSGGKSVRWKLVESDFFKKNEGSWALKGIDQGRTQVHYELDISFGFLVPGWIAKKLTEVNLPRMLDSYERRAVEIRNKKDG